MTSLVTSDQLPGSSTMETHPTGKKEATQDLVWTRDDDLEDKLHEQGHHSKRSSFSSLLLMSFSTLGIVYGDIGTSPLYVYSSIYPDGAPDDDNQILGSFSMIFWTITVVVLLKYVLIMLRADDNGEGGVISLYSLIKRAAGMPTLTHVGDKDPGGKDSNENYPKFGRIARAMKDSLQRKHWQQVALLVIVLAGVNMIINRIGPRLWFAAAPANRCF